MSRYTYYKGTDFPDRQAKDAAIREDVLKEMGSQQLSTRKLARCLGVSATHLGLVLKGARTSHTLLDDAAEELSLSAFDDRDWERSQP